MKKKSDPGTGRAELDRLRAAADEYGVELITALADDALDPALVRDVPVDWVRAHRLLPVRHGGRVCVLCCDPSQVSEQEYLALLLGQDLQLLLASRDVVTDAIDACYYRRADTAEAFLQDLEDVDGIVVEETARPDDLLRETRDAPASRFVNVVLLEAVKRGASDIHFEPFEARLRVRYRIDGVLYEQASPPKSMEESVVSRLKVMARMDIAEKRVPQDGMARVRVGAREIDIRVSTVPVAEGERVVLRLLNKESALLAMDILGMAGDVYARLTSAMKVSNGLIVVAGPTGSGKTTTLYAALQHLNTERRNIMTVEDPIEYQLDNIGQMRVRPKIGLTFANGLRHILRQDPDVILVGETRDLETAEIAVRASLTGHLVFTTLHTNEAVGVVPRLRDMGVEAYLLAACLRAALAQRLVRKLCPACRKESDLSAADLKPLGDVGRSWQGHAAWEAVGCDACLEGYRGRLGLFELFATDDEILDAIRKGAEEAALRRMAQDSGMAGLATDGLQKVGQGITSLAEVLRTVL